jgi:hypothetical protein
MAVRKEKWTSTSGKVFATQALANAEDLSDNFKLWYDTHPVLNGELLAIPLLRDYMMKWVTDHGAEALTKLVPATE